MIVAHKIVVPRQPLFVVTFQAQPWPKAMIDSILSSTIPIPIPTFGQNLAYISDVLIGISFGWRETCMFSFNECRGKARLYRSCTASIQPYNEVTDTIIYDASGISEL